MLNVTLLTAVAKSALVGAVATKIVDTLISSKINNKIEQNKWLRNTKLELFSKLTEDILSTDSSNIEHQLREIKKTSAKIVLLINDRKLSDKIEHYTNTLIRFSENERVEKSALSLVNKDMVSFLSRNIKL
jgi:phosphotransacetylase